MTEAADSTSELESGGIIESMLDGRRRDKNSTFSNSRRMAACAATVESGLT